MVHGHGVAQRGDQVGLELVPHGTDAGGIVGLAEDGRHACGVLQPSPGEEVVPVRVHRFRGIAFVADRRGQQPEELALVGCTILRRAAGLTQRIDVADCSVYVGPHGIEQWPVAGMAPVFHHQVDELAVAVVLGHRVGAALVHAAGHLAAGVLVGGVPIDELAHHIGLAKAEQCGGSECAVTNPGSLVGARPGLQCGAIPIDQDVAEGALNRAGQMIVGRRQGDGGPVEAFLPVGRCFCERLLHHRWIATRQVGSPARRQRNVDAHHGGIPWSEHHRVGHRSRGEAADIAGQSSLRQPSPP